ncbi:IS481 family transposase [Salinibacterium sp. ZJ70]|uniref:IS481 family transposase n=1 Tax=Salinibacterium sp. ZJ70 TaxID=2708084 RepID=UPI0017498572|nr:IS481 family transposase [Salinibacterium sp. ZJ70]
MTHANAPLAPEGRLRLARLIIEQGWSVRRAAERFQCSPATAAKWAARYRAGIPMTDRSSRPHRSPSRCPKRLERRIIALRFSRRWGPHRISYHLGVPRSTVGRVLERYRMPLLQHLDQSTGLPVRKPRSIRYEKARPGELVHVDIKKLGRIPNGGGHRMLGRTAGNRNNKKQGRGYSFLHHAVDDYSRLAYSEIHTDERRETAAGFWIRARAFFQQAGFEVEAVMTDNGPCYRSHLFATALGQARHIFTRPYRPQTNGKVERFNRTLATEWAYARTYTSDEARAADYPAWLHHYNHHRPHTGIGGLTPSTRVHNLTGNYI